MLNLSDTSGGLRSTVWAPNRQAIRNLKGDLSRYELIVKSPSYQSALDSLSPYHNVSISHSNFRLFRNALQAQLSHNGPTIGYSTSCYHNVSVISVSTDSSVRCYNIPNPETQFDGEPIYYPYPLSDTGSKISTMCIRTGLGWGGATNQTQFNITNSIHGNMSVDVYASDRAIYLNPTSFHCSAHNTTQNESSCDWEGLFAAEVAQEMRNATFNLQIVEYNPAGYGTTWCRSVAYLKFSKYSYDLSRSANPLDFVVLDDGEPAASMFELLRIHPDWFLAAWSLNASNPVLDGKRAGAELLVGVTKLATQSGELKGVSILHRGFMGQLLSLINYETTEDAPAAANDTKTPALTATFKTRVWSYGFSSRTSKLGLVVVSLGCLLVLVRLVVRRYVRAAPRAPLDLVVAALKQEPPHIFTSLDLDRKDWGKVRFRAENTEDAPYIIL
jgi:hypothetical protein